MPHKTDSLVMSHELRTPLFNIKSYVETLHDLKDQLSNEEQLEFLGIANSETDRQQTCK